MYIAKKDISALRLVLECCDKDELDKLLTEIKDASRFSHFDNIFGFDEESEESQVDRVLYALSKAYDALTALTLAEDAQYLLECELNPRRKRIKEFLARHRLAFACLRGSFFGFLIAKLLCFLCGL